MRSIASMLLAQSAKCQESGDSVPGGGASRNCGGMEKPDEREFLLLFWFMNNIQ